MIARAQSKRLGDTVAFIRGITFKPEELVASHSTDAIVCMRTKNVQSELDQSDLIAVPRNLVRSKEKMLREGDVLVSTANSFELVGKCCWVPQLAYSATAGGFISIFRPISKELDPRYFYHWLASRPIQHKLRYAGRQTTNISNLNFEIAAELQIPLPPLDEQKRIAAILDKADALRRKRAETLRLTDQFLQSVFLYSVGPLAPDYEKWKSSRFEALAADIPGSMRTGPFGSDLKHSEFVDKGIAVLGIDNAVQNRFAWAERRYITKEKYEALKRYTVRPQDVIVTIMGTTGRSAVVPADIPTAVSTKHLATITVNRELVFPEFLSFCIHSHPEILQQIAAANKGAIMNGLNLGIIKDLELKLPPINRQERFVECLRQVDEVHGKAERFAAHIEECFASLSQRAFQGDL